MQENIVTKETLKHALQGAGGGATLYRHLVTADHIGTTKSAGYAEIVTDDPTPLTTAEQFVEITEKYDGHIPCTWITSNDATYTFFSVRSVSTAFYIYLYNFTKNGNFSVNNEGIFNNYTFEDTVVEI